MIPELIDIGIDRRVLPHGRYQTSFDEIQERFIPTTDINRQQIWDQFLEANSFFQAAIGGIFSIWIGGSFITSKENPQDIDVTYLLRSDQYSLASTSAQGRVAIDILRKFERSPFKFEKVDHYFIIIPPTSIACAPTDYMQQRGYWDQFWSKTRNAVPYLPTYPKCGYLEVIIDE